MTEKWTPGPHHASGPYVFAGKDCIAICDTDNASEKRMEANATLFAAAPDMAADHAENSRILGYLLNELQGLVPAGKLAALAGCKERSDRSYAKARGEA